MAKFSKAVNTDFENFETKLIEKNRKVHRPRETAANPKSFDEKTG